MQTITETTEKTLQQLSGTEGIPLSDKTYIKSLVLKEFDTKYSKPVGGIPTEDLDVSVLSALNKANTALQSETYTGTYSKPVGGIPTEDLDTSVRNALSRANAALTEETYRGNYSKPASGIPTEDLDSSVQNALSKANGSVQSSTVSISGNTLTIGDKTYTPTGMTSSDITFDTVKGWGFVKSVNDVTPYNGNVVIDVPTSLSLLSDDATHRLVSDTDIQNWNNKTSFTLPEGGTNGQVLKKNGASVEWANDNDNILPTFSSSNAGKVLKVNNSGNLEWSDDLNDNVPDASEITTDSTHRFVTDSSITAWNNKSEFTLPSGGTDGQVLKKSGNSLVWSDDLQGEDSLPTSTSGDSGKILNVNASGLPTWTTIADASISLSDLKSDSTHRTVTDASIDAWNNSKSELVLPEGGTDGQVLKKSGDSLVWSDDLQGGSGLPDKTSASQNDILILSGADKTPSWSSIADASISLSDLKSDSEHRTVTDASIDQWNSGESAANYTWVRYADDANGSNISYASARKSYIGFAFNMSEPPSEATNNPSDYTWSQLKGDETTAYKLTISNNVWSFSGDSPYTIKDSANSNITVSRVTNGVLSIQDFILTGTVPVNGTLDGKLRVVYPSTINYTQCVKDTDNRAHVVCDSVYSKASHTFDLYYNDILVDSVSIQCLKQGSMGGAYNLSLSNDTAVIDNDSVSVSISLATSNEVTLYFGKDIKDAFFRVESSTLPTTDGKALFVKKSPGDSAAVVSKTVNADASWLNDTASHNVTFCIGKSGANELDSNSHYEVVIGAYLSKTGSSVMNKKFTISVLDMTGYGVSYSLLISPGTIAFDNNAQDGDNSKTLDSDIIVSKISNGVVTAITNFVTVSSSDISNAATLFIKDKMYVEYPSDNNVVVAGKNITCVKYRESGHLLKLWYCAANGTGTNKNDILVQVDAETIDCIKGATVVNGTSPYLMTMSNDAAIIDDTVPADLTVFNKNLNYGTYNTFLVWEGNTDITSSCTLTCTDSNMPDDKLVCRGGVDIDLGYKLSISALENAKLTPNTFCIQNKATGGYAINETLTKGNYYYTISALKGGRVIATKTFTFNVDNISEDGSLYTLTIQNDNWHYDGVMDEYNHYLKKETTTSTITVNKITSGVPEAMTFSLSSTVPQKTDNSLTVFCPTTTKVVTLSGDSKSATIECDDYYVQATYSFSLYYNNILVDSETIDCQQDGKQGTSPYSMTMSNDSVVIDTDTNDAGVQNITKNTVSVYEGTNTASCYYKIEDSTITTGSIYSMSDDSKGIVKVYYNNAVIDVLALDGAWINSDTMATSVSFCLTKTNTNDFEKDKDYTLTIGAYDASKKIRLCTKTFNVSFRELAGVGVSYSLSITPDTVQFPYNVQTGDDSGAVSLSLVATKTENKDNGCLVTNPVIKACYTTNNYLDQTYEDGELYIISDTATCTIEDNVVTHVFYNSQGVDVRLYMAMGDSAANLVLVDSESIDCLLQGPKGDGAYTVTLSNDSAVVDVECNHALVSKLTSCTASIYEGEEQVDVYWKVTSNFSDKSELKVYAGAEVAATETEYANTGDKALNTSFHVGRASTEATSDLTIYDYIVTVGAYSDAERTEKILEKQFNVSVKQLEGEGVSYTLDVVPDVINFDKYQTSTSGLDMNISATKLTNKYNAYNTEDVSIYGYVTTNNKNSATYVKDKLYVVYDASLMTISGNKITAANYFANGSGLELYMALGTTSADLIKLDSETIDCVKNGEKGDSAYSVTLSNDTAVIDVESVHSDICQLTGCTASLYLGESLESCYWKVTDNFSNGGSELKVYKESTKQSSETAYTNTFGLSTSFHVGRTNTSGTSDLTIKDYSVTVGAYSNSARTNLILEKQFNVSVKQLHGKGVSYRLNISPDVVTFNSDATTTTPSGNISLGISASRISDGVASAQSITNYITSTIGSSFVAGCLYVKYDSNKVTISSDTVTNVKYSSTGHALELYYAESSSNLVKVDAETIDCIKNGGPGETTKGDTGTTLTGSGTIVVNPTNKTWTFNYYPQLLNYKGTPSASYKFVGLNNGSDLIKSATSGNNNVVVAMSEDMMSNNSSKSFNGTATNISMGSATFTWAKCSLVIVTLTVDGMTYTDTIIRSGMDGWTFNVDETGFTSMQSFNNSISSLNQTAANITSAVSTISPNLVNSGEWNSDKSDWTINKSDSDYLRLTLTSLVSISSSGTTTVVYKVNNNTNSTFTNSITTSYGTLTLNVTLNNSSSGCSYTLKENSTNSGYHFIGFSTSSSATSGDATYTATNLKSTPTVYAIYGKGSIEFSSATGVPSGYQVTAKLYSGTNGPYLVAKNLTDGEKYTASAWIKTTANNGHYPTINFGFDNECTYYLTSGSWKKYTHTFTFIQVGNRNYKALSFYFSKNKDSAYEFPSSFTAYISSIQVEKGGLATDWKKPGTTLSEISQLSDEISANVGSNKGIIIDNGTTYLANKTAGFVARTDSTSTIASSKLGTDYAAGAGYMADGTISWKADGTVNIGKKNNTVINTLSPDGTLSLSNGINTINPDGRFSFGNGLFRLEDTINFSDWKQTNVIIGNDKNNGISLGCDTSRDDTSYKIALHDSNGSTSSTLSGSMADIIADEHKAYLRLWGEGVKNNDKYPKGAIEMHVDGTSSNRALINVFLLDWNASTTTNIAAYHITPTGAGSASDITIKENFKDIVVSLNDMANAPLFEFNFIGSFEKHVGTSALYWEPILPTTVKRFYTDDDKEGKLSVDYANLSYILAASLAKEVKELKQTIKLLQDKLDSQK